LTKLYAKKSLKYDMRKVHGVIPYWLIKKMVLRNDCVIKGCGEIEEIVYQFHKTTICSRFQYS